MLVTKDLATWALSISQIFLAFSPSHYMLHYYGFDLTQSLAFANVDIGNLWFSHQHLNQILIRFDLLLLSFSSEFLCPI